MMFWNDRREVPNTMDIVHEFVIYLLSIPFI